MSYENIVGSNLPFPFTSGSSLWRYHLVFFLLGFNQTHPTVSFLLSEHAVSLFRTGKGNTIVRKVPFIPKPNLPLVWALLSAPAMTSM